MHRSSFLCFVNAVKISRKLDKRKAIFYFQLIYSPFSTLLTESDPIWKIQLQNSILSLFCTSVSLRVKFSRENIKKVQLDLIYRLFFLFSPRKKLNFSIPLAVRN
jgi:hypothetical protein